ncbi:MAG: hypothetical protein ABI229_12635 [Gemmatimonadaceae bacterium]
MTSKNFRCTRTAQVREHDPAVDSPVIVPRALAREVAIPWGQRLAYTALPSGNYLVAQAKL